MNRVMLIGQLTADPKLSELESGVQRAAFGVATNYSWKDANDEWQENVDFHDVVAWRRTAERMAKLKKGKTICVEGKLRTHSWDADDGTKRTRTEVVASRVFVIEKDAAGNAPAKANTNVTAADTDGVEVEEVVA